MFKLWIILLSNFNLWIIVIHRFAVFYYFFFSLWMLFCIYFIHEVLRNSLSVLDLALFLLLILRIELKCFVLILYNSLLWLCFLNLCLMLQPTFLSRHFLWYSFNLCSLISCIVSFHHIFLINLFFKCIMW